MGMQKFFVVASTGTHATIDLEAMNDPVLSWKAKALHYYIRTRGEVVTNQDALVNAGPDGRDAVNSGVKELIQRHYLHLTQIREDGKFKFAAYISFPKPVELTAEQLKAMIEHGRFDPPYPEKPYTGNPLHGAECGRLGVSVRNTFDSLAKAKPQKDVSYRDDAVAERVERIFIYWNKQPNLPTHRRGAQYKTFKTLTAHIRAALRSHSRMVIEEAIKTYNALLGHPYTILRGGSAPDRVGLNEFFKFGYHGNKVRSNPKHHLHHAESWFNECRQGMDYLLKRYGALRSNKHPQTAEAIASELFYTHGIGKTELTTRDINCVRQCAERVVKFFDENRDRLPKRMGTPQLAVELVKSTGDTMHPGYLISDITWANFEDYLAEQGIIERRVSGRTHAQTAAGI